MEKLYHYTNGTKVRLIIESGVLRASPEKPKPREKRVCWLSSNSVWEKTANKIVMTGDGQSKLLNQDETEDFCNGLFRFVIDPANYPDAIFQWPRLGVEARINQTIKKRLVSRAKKAKVKPEQWFGTIGDIDINRTTLEKLIDGKWQPISFDEAYPNKSHRTVVNGGAMKYLPTSDSEWGNV